MEISENLELLERYHKNVAFLKKMQHLQLKYREIQQTALYTHASQSHKMVISLKKQQKQWWNGCQQSMLNVEMIMGCKLPKGDKSIENIILNIAILIPRPKEPYSIVFVNTSADSGVYSGFKKALDYLPLDYYIQLQNIYILHASFKTKAYNLITFDYMANFIKNKTVYEDSFQKLTERLGINCEQVIKILPKQVIQELGKNQKSANQYLKQQKVDKVVQLMLKQVKHSPLSKNIQEYEVGQTGAPLIIELLIYFFDRDNQYLKTEGIFRISANIEQERELLIELSLQNYNYLQKVTDPHLAANAIKRFLSNLEEPIISYQHFDALMKSSSSNYKHLLSKIIRQLDQARKMTLLLLIEFLKERVIPLENVNLMTQQNMTKVLGLCIMRAEVASLKDIIFAQKIIGVTLVLFNHFDELFGNKLERLKLIRTTMHVKQGKTLKEKLGSLQFLQIDQQLPDLQSLQRQELNQNRIQQDDLDLTEQQIRNLEQADQLLNHFNQKI